MSSKVKSSQDEEVLTYSQSQTQINKDIVGLTEKIDTPTITSRIGKGDDAKNSIIWTTIRWCLAIPLIMSIFLFISLWASYYYENYEEAKDIKDSMLKIWAIFAPLITSALGYLYGKRSECIEEKS